MMEEDEKQQKEVTMSIKLRKGVISWGKNN
jgi:hypothetical protein